LIRVRGRAAGDYADEVARGDRVGGGPANALAVVLALGARLGERQAAGSHAAVLAAGALVADIAGLKAYRPVESRFDPEVMCPLDHLLGGRVDGRFHRVG
jgi:hypothetical protein